MLMAMVRGQGRVMGEVRWVPGTGYPVCKVSFSMEKAIMSIPFIHHATSSALSEKKEKTR